MGLRALLKQAHTNNHWNDLRWTTLNHKSPSVDGWMEKVKVYTRFTKRKLLSLPDNAIFSPWATIKICTLSKAPPPIWPCHQHTHKTSENFTYGFVLGPLQFQSTGQSTHLTSGIKNSNFESSSFQVMASWLLGNCVWAYVSWKTHMWQSWVEIEHYSVAYFYE